MGVCVAGSSGTKAGVHADEDADEVRSEGVCEIVPEVSIL